MASKYVAPDRLEYGPLVSYLPDELFSDTDSDDYDDSDSSSDEEERLAIFSSLKAPAAAAEAAATADEEELQLKPPPRRNGQVVPMVTPQAVALSNDANSISAIELLTDMIVYKFEPNQPDFVDRMSAMLNAGRPVEPDVLAQKNRLEAKRRRRAQRRKRFFLRIPPDWSPPRQKLSMAECFCTLGRLLVARPTGDLDLAIPSTSSVAVTSSSSSSTSSDEVDEGASGCSTASPPPPPSPKEVSNQISDDILSELGRLCPESEKYFRRLVIGSTTGSQLIHFCPEVDSEAALQRHWQRYSARQLRRSEALEKRLNEDVHDCLERRLSGVLYESSTCSVLANVLAGDLLELVMHLVGDEFKIVCMFLVSSVTDLDSMAMETRSLQSGEIDICKVFHYQNESICALFTCHLFQRFDRPLYDAPFDTASSSLSGSTRDTSTTLDDDGFKTHVQGKT